MDLELLRLFVAVAETASFSAAAKRLQLPKSSVSRGVARFEAALGAELFHRTTRQVSLSTAGAALYDKAGPLMAALQEALGALPEREEDPAGELRITSPIDLGSVLLAEILPRFCARYPRVRIDAHVTNRRVEIVNEGFDLALRIVSGKLADSSLVARKLAVLEFQLFASPSYLARRGAPRASEDLAAHDWVHFRPWTGSKRLGIDPKKARIVADDFLFLREALREGAGIGLLPTFIARNALKNGELVRVLPRYADNAGTLTLMHPKSQHVPRKVKAFRDFVIDAIAQRPLA